jgi:hypothetical protein
MRSSSCYTHKFLSQAPTAKQATIYVGEGDENFRSRRCFPICLINFYDDSDFFLSLSENWFWWINHPRSETLEYRKIFQLIFFLSPARAKVYWTIYEINLVIFIYATADMLFIFNINRPLCFLAVYTVEKSNIRKAYFNNIAKKTLVCLLCCTYFHVPLFKSYSFFSAFVHPTQQRLWCA